MEQSKQPAPEPGEYSHVELESLCTQCGKCCYKKLRIGRHVYITPFPCEFLDINTNLCTIYDRRHELNPECLDLKDAFKHNAFPSDCGYVPAIAPPNYKAAREDYDWSEDFEDFDAFAEEMEADARLTEIVRARGPYAPMMYEDVNERKAAEAQMKTPILADLVRERNEAAPVKPVQTKAETKAKKGRAQA